MLEIVLWQDTATVPDKLSMEWRVCSRISCRATGGDAMQLQTSPHRIGRSQCVRPRFARQLISLFLSHRNSHWVHHLISQASHASRVRASDSVNAGRRDAPLDRRSSVSQAQVPCQTLFAPLICKACQHGVGSLHSYEKHLRCRLQGRSPAGVSLRFYTLERCSSLSSKTPSAAYS